MGDDASSERKGRKNREQAPHRVFLLEIFRRASAINEALVSLSQGSYRRQQFLRMRQVNGRLRRLSCRTKGGP